jgi:hypothetical protein
MPRQNTPARARLLSDRLHGLLDCSSVRRMPLTIAVGRRNNVSNTNVRVPGCDVYSYDSVTLVPVLLGSNR